MANRHIVDGVNISECYAYIHNAKEVNNDNE